MEYAVGERDLRRLPQRRPNFIDGCISSYCYILKSPERLEQIRKANKLASVLCDLESDRIREKEEKKKKRRRLKTIEGRNLKRSRLGRTRTS